MKLKEAIDIFCTFLVDTKHSQVFKLPESFIEARSEIRKFEGLEKRLADDILKESYTDESAN